MTHPQDNDLNGADSNDQLQDRTRFRVEVSAKSHQSLREAALEDGKHMKVLAEEILQNYFEQRSSRDSSPNTQEGESQSQ